MSLSYLRADGHKQVVTHIRESQWFESMYTLQGKPAQHAPRIPRSVYVWSQTIRFSRGQRITTLHIVINRFEQIHCSREEGLLTNPHHTDWLVCGSVPSFCPIIANEAVGKRQASIDNRLLGLPDSYLQHVIGTFNTCSRGPTHRSLNDTSGGYNLRGAGFSHLTPRPSQPTVLHFSPKGLTRSQVIQSQHKPLVKWCETPITVRGLSMARRLPKPMSTPRNG
jgi:hypothetical protein